MTRNIAVWADLTRFERGTPLSGYPYRGSSFRRAVWPPLALLGGAP
jgi:hypothetical protein